MERDKQFQLKLGKLIDESVPTKSFDVRLKYEAETSTLIIEDMISDTVTNVVVKRKSVGRILMEVLRFFHMNNYLAKENK